MGRGLMRCRSGCLGVRLHAALVLLCWLAGAGLVLGLSGCHGGPPPETTEAARWANHCRIIASDWGDPGTLVVNDLASHFYSDALVLPCFSVPFVVRGAYGLAQGPQDRCIVHRESQAYSMNQIEVLAWSSGVALCLLSEDLPRGLVVRGCTIAPDGDQVASVVSRRTPHGYVKELRLGRISRGELLASPALPLRPEVPGLGDPGVWCPDGRHLLLTAWDGSNPEHHVYVVDTATGRVLRFPRGPWEAGSLVVDTSRRAVGVLAGVSSDGGTLFELSRDCRRLIPAARFRGYTLYGGSVPPARDRVAMLEYSRPRQADGQRGSVLVCVLQTREGRTVARVPGWKPDRWAGDRLVVSTSGRRVGMLSADGGLLWAQNLDDVGFGQYAPLWP